MRAIILCKAPVAGRVKTRLMPEYSAQQAADWHKKMVAAVLSKVQQAAFHDIWLAVDDVGHQYFQELRKGCHFNLCFQGDGDLGERLHYLMSASFKQDQQSILFLGADSPHVDSSRYKEAQKRLETCDVVLGPVEDGGYDLIALKEPKNGLFQGISWGTDKVLTETLDACKNNGWEVDSLKLSFDLDRIADLQRSAPETWLSKNDSFNISIFK